MDINYNKIKQKFKYLVPSTPFTFQSKGHYKMWNAKTQFAVAQCRYKDVRKMRLFFVPK